jgi:hypothetical protein
MSKEEFDRLLEWFGPDRDTSAEKYVEAHARLTRLFHFDGCNRPEDLADEVMNRVARRSPPPYSDHIAVLLGFARFVRLEYRVEKMRFVQGLDPGEEPSGADETALKETRARCVDSCLESLPEDDRQLLREYYEYEPGAKIQRRKAMAEARHTTLNALRLKACRLKSVVAPCVKRCFQSDGITGVQ